MNDKIGMLLLSTNEDEMKKITLIYMKYMKLLNGNQDLQSLLECYESMMNNLTSMSIGEKRYLKVIDFIGSFVLDGSLSLINRLSKWNIRHESQWKKIEELLNGEKENQTKKFIDNLWLLIFQELSVTNLENVVSLLKLHPDINSRSFHLILQVISKRPKFDEESLNLSFLSRTNCLMNDDLRQWKNYMRYIQSIVEDNLIENEHHLKLILSVFHGDYETTCDNLSLWCKLMENESSFIHQIILLTFYVKPFASKKELIVLQRNLQKTIDRTHLNWINKIYWDILHEHYSSAIILLIQSLPNYLQFDKFQLSYEKCDGSSQLFLFIVLTLVFQTIKIYQDIQSSTLSSQSMDISSIGCTDLINIMEPILIHFQNQTNQLIGRFVELSSLLSFDENYLNIPWNYKETIINNENINSEISKILPKKISVKSSIILTDENSKDSFEELFFLKFFHLFSPSNYLELEEKSWINSDISHLINYLVKNKSFSNVSIRNIFLYHICNLILNLKKKSLKYYEIDNCFSFSNTTFSNQLIQVHFRYMSNVLISNSLDVLHIFPLLKSYGKSNHLLRISNLTEKCVFFAKTERLKNFRYGKYFSILKKVLVNGRNHKDEEESSLRKWRDLWNEAELYFSSAESTIEWHRQFSVIQSYFSLFELLFEIEKEYLNDNYEIFQPSLFQSIQQCENNLNKNFRKFKIILSNFIEMTIGEETSEFGKRLIEEEIKNFPYHKIPLLKTFLLFNIIILLAYLWKIVRKINSSQDNHLQPIFLELIDTHDEDDTGFDKYVELIVECCRQEKGNKDNKDSALINQLSNDESLTTNEKLIFEYFQKRLYKTTDKANPSDVNDCYNSDFILRTANLVKMRNLGKLLPITLQNIEWLLEKFRRIVSTFPMECQTLLSYTISRMYIIQRTVQMNHKLQMKIILDEFVNNPIFNYEENLNDKNTFKVNANKVSPSINNVENNLLFFNKLLYS
ncbi:hypothetical protein SNEBB_008763 [Seison nebaliae]|nr:hypothetical protein SNEBB_008763 [Seison nebaliae]